MASRAYAAGEGDPSSVAKQSAAATTIEDLESTDGAFTFILNTYQSAVSSLYWVLFGLHHNTSMPMIAFALCVLVQVFQWFSFVFFATSDLPWSLGRWTSWITTASSWACNFLGMSVSGNIASIVLALFIPVMCAVAMVTYKFFKWVWTMNAFRVYLVCCYQILFFPIVGSQTRMIFGCLQWGNNHTHAYFQELQCAGEKFWILFAFNCFSLLLFVTFMIIFAACYFEINPNQRRDFGDGFAADARSSGRGDVLYAIIRVAVMVFFVVFTQFNAHRWPLSLLTVFVGCMLLRHDYYYLPYYHVQAQMLIVYRNLAVICSGVCMSIANITGDGDRRGAIYVFYASMTIVLVVMAVLFVRMRIDQVCNPIPSDQQMMSPAMLAYLSLLDLSRSHPPLYSTLTSPSLSLLDTC